MEPWILPQMETSSWALRAGFQLRPLVRFTGSVHLWHSLSSLAAVVDTSCCAGLLLLHSIFTAKSLIFPPSWISHLSCLSDKPAHNLSCKTQVTIAATFWVCMCLCMEEKKEEEKIPEKDNSLGDQKVISRIWKGQMKIRSVNFLGQKG